MIINSLVAISIFLILLFGFISGSASLSLKAMIYENESLKTSRDEIISTKAYLTNSSLGDLELR